MDDREDNARRTQSRRSIDQHHLHHQSSLWPSRRSKLPTRTPSHHCLAGDRFTGPEVDYDENMIQEDDDLEDYDESNGYNDDDIDLYAEHTGYDPTATDSDDSSEKYRKKRKLETLDVGRVLNSTVDWSEEETLVLLEVWGERFLQCGRRSLRGEEWKEVAERVDEVVKQGRTEEQCRARFDAVKKRYRKEKEKANGGSKWVYFQKMDVLMCSAPSQDHGLACGIDGGEYVFMDPGVYLRYSNGLDEMRDSPESSDLSGDDDSDGVPHRRRGSCGGGSSIRLLADSIHRFGEIYEKIEESKRQQLMELEKMRIDFQEEIERQRKLMIEKAQTEIVKIQQEDEDDDYDDGDTDPSLESPGE